MQRSSQLTSRQLALKLKLSNFISKKFKSGHLLTTLFLLYKKDAPNFGASFFDELNLPPADEVLAFGKGFMIHHTTDTAQRAGRGGACSSRKQGADQSVGEGSLAALTRRPESLSEPIIVHFGYYNFIQGFINAIGDNGRVITFGTKCRFFIGSVRNDLTAFK